MLKQIFLCCAILMLFIAVSLPCSALEISAKHAVLVECDSGDIVFSKNENEIAPMASTTKIMTAIVAIENADLDKAIIISEQAIGVEGSSIYLKSGERFTLRELLYALLLESANDVAIAIAIELGESINGFADMMNSKANELGLKNTHFTNPHGLDDPNHYTCALDLAKIATYAMGIPEFCEIVSCAKQIIGDNSESRRLLVNHNKLLKLYDGAIGIKTGFTKKSGRCLVSCAIRDGVKLICVTLNAPSDWNDHKLLLDLGFEQYERIPLAEPGDYSISLDCVNGRKPQVICSNLEGLSVTIRKEDKQHINAIFEAKRFVFAPIKQGESIGRIVYYLDGKRIAALDICALESIKPVKYKKSIIERIFS